MRYVFIGLIMMAIAMIAFKPNNPIIVQGQLKDELGAPIVGAMVCEKGKNNCTVTDTAGKYKLTVSSENSTLVFSSIGYSSVNVKVNGRSTVNAQAKPTVNKLEEVVVTALGIADAEYEPGNSRGNYNLAQRKAKSSYPPPTPRYGNADTAFNTEGYDAITENRFKDVKGNPLSTFSIDVDAASYSNIRRFLTQGQMPPAGSVRIEEMINYFHYDYPQPTNEDPFSINTEMAECPWNKNHRLVLIGLQGRKIPTVNLPPSNLVFLIDVSGSMEDENKLPLVKASMKLLVEQLREQDRVAIVVYAGNAGLVLPSTSGANKQRIKDAIDRLEAGGSTAGGAGIKLAYQVARQNLAKQGNNRVILCTDGDFNVGESSDASLESMIEKERQSGVFLTVLGYGMGNYQDAKMQKLADKGNGNHAYIDGINEARKVLVNEFGGTLFTIAKDVKLQIEFNPFKVQAYRLIGYENRMLNKEDFNNDQKDAGELGSGHTVTALYEIIPVGAKNEFQESVDPLKYQTNPNPGSSEGNEIMTVKFRYKKPDGDQSKLIVHPVIESLLAFNRSSDNFRFAAAVAEFGLLLNKSDFKQQSSYANVTKLAQGALSKDEEGYRREFLQLVSKAFSIAGGHAMDDDDEDVGVK